MILEDHGENCQNEKYGMRGVKTLIIEDIENAILVNKKM